ncbi:hypothetical protein ACFE04_014889 [Oxalis oulophora]
MSSDASHSLTHALRDSHPSSGKPPLKWKARGDIDDEGSNSSGALVPRSRKRGISKIKGQAAVMTTLGEAHSRSDKKHSTFSEDKVSSLSSSSKYIGLYFGRSRLGRISSSSGRRVKRIDPYMLQGEVFTIHSRAPRLQVVWMNENHQWAYSTEGFHEVFEGHESLMTFSSGRFFGPLLLAKAFTFTRTYNDSPNICWLEFEPARGVFDHASSSVIVLESMLPFIWRSMTARESVEVLAKERKKQAEKSVEREAVATENEVNLADNGSSWDGNGHGNVEQPSLPENLSGAAPGNLSRAESEHPAEAELETGAGEEPGTSSEHIIAPPRTGQTVGSTSRQTAMPNNVRLTSQPTGPSNAPTNNGRSTSQPTRPSNTVRSTSQPTRPSNTVRSISQATPSSNAPTNRSTSQPTVRIWHKLDNCCRRM